MCLVNKERTDKAPAICIEFLSGLIFINQIKHDYLLRTERLFGTLECPKCKRVQNEKAKTSAKRIINVPWHS